MLANHNPVKTYTHGFVAPNPVRDLEAYDKLPRTVRRLIDECPAAICAVHTARFYKANGLAAVRREIRATADLFYEAYAKETGVPRPTKPIGKGMGKKRWLR